MDAAPIPSAAPASPPVPSSPLDEALGVLFTLGASALRARRCSLYLRGDDGVTLDLRGQRGLNVVEARHIPAEGTIAGLVMHSRVSLLVQNIQSHPVLPVHPDRYITPSFISVPVLVENNAQGVLNVADRQDGQPFSEEDLQSAEMVARSMAAVLHSDLLARRARGESEIDPVSGLYDARYLHKRVAQEVERAQLNSVPFTVLLLNIGCYPDVATRIGVQAAGVLMRCAGEIVAQAVRQSDVLARRADDEIAVLLPSTPIDGARRLARAIARDITVERLPAHLRYDVEDVRACLGVAAYVPGMDADSVLQAADDALARARAGRETMAVEGDDIVEAATGDTSTITHQQAIATALRLGIPYLADPAASAGLAAIGLLSVEMARTYACFPVAFEGGTLTLAMANPTDAGAIQAIAQYTNMAVYPVASPREKILQAIATLMRPGAARAHSRIRLHVPETPDVRRFTQQLDDVIRRIADAGIQDLTVEGMLNFGVDSPANRAELVNVLTGLPDASLQQDSSDRDLWHAQSDER